MTEPNGHQGWHEMLLALAGWMPDAELTAIRSAADEPTRTARFLAGASALGLDEAAAATLLSDVRPGDAAAAARALNAAARRPRPQYRFAPLDPVSATGPGPSEPAEGLPFGVQADPLDVTGVEVGGWSDPVAATVVQAIAAEEPGVRGIWAAWRSGAGTESTRVFLVEVADSPAPTAPARRSFPTVDAQVEIIATTDELPDYHRSLLASGALVWAHAGTSGPEVVPVFDDVDPKYGPRFGADHLMLEDEERRKVTAYLSGAEAVLLTTATMIDVVDASRGEVVPLSYRTDGSFVWPDAVPYYVEHYGLAPHLPLLETIRAAQYIPPRPDGVALFRAETALMQPDE
jgi:hypothetical protein